MGTVDIEKEVDELMLGDGMFMADDSLSYDEIRSIVKEIVTEVTEHHYKCNDGEIEDWDMWEQDIRIALNDRFGE